MARWTCRWQCATGAFTSVGHCAAKATFPAASCATLTLGVLRTAALLLAAVFAGGSALRAEEPPAVDTKSLSSLAELPHWPIGFVPPNFADPQPGKTGKVSAPVLAWAPPGAKHLRALFIIPNNTDSKHVGEHAAVRAVAAKREMAIVYLRNGDVPDVQGVLNALAEGTGIPEFRHAPWIVLGKSSRGKFPILMEWKYPDRTIAGISYHAETPTWPPDASAKLNGQTILHVNANGETEWGGTWFIHVRPSLLNYRAQEKWLPHQVVAKGVDHGNYPDGAGSPGWGQLFAGKVTCIQVWDYLAVYIDKAIELRVPKDTYATDAPVKLNQVDDATGYVIDPFAIEDMFRQPHYPLNSSPTEYLVGAAGESPTSGFVAIPAADYKVPEGVPVAPLAVGRSPSAWLITQGMKFAMKNDPMTDLAGLEKLRPQPGDKVVIDDFEATFRPLPAKSVPPKGGISLSGIKQWGQAVSLLAYTILDVPEPVRLKLQAAFSVAGRLQVVLNGVPVEYKQVVEFQKGLYPMLVVLRLDGPNWGGIDPLFVAVSQEEVGQAQEYQAEKAKRQAEQAKILAEGLKVKTPPIRKAADVPKEERKKMFWVADREQAEAWFKLHAIHGQAFDVP